MKRVLLSFCVFVTAGACSPISHDLHRPARESVTQELGYLTTSGANALFPSTPFEKIDLLQLIDPENKRCHGPCTPVGDDRPISDADFEAAFTAFYAYDGGQARALRLRRNRVQDRVLAASEQRCSVYKLYLQRVQSEDQSMFGSLTTILAGAGAIATGQINSRVFAGLAGITSGVGAEMQQAYFGNLAARVIVPAIDVRRKAILDEIVEHQKRAIGSYSVQRALMDAAKYHGACTVTSGLNQAAESLNPGLATMNKTLATLRTTKTLLDPNSTAEDLKAALSAANGGQAAAGTGAGSGDEPSLPSELFQASIERIGAAFAALQGAVTARKEVVDKAKGAADTEKAGQKVKLDAIASAATTSFATITTSLSKQCLTTAMSHERKQLELETLLKAAAAADRAKSKQALVEARIKFDIEAGAVLEKRADLIVEQLKAVEADVVAGAYDAAPTTITTMASQVPANAC
jgi:hypothetical protein